MAAEEKLKQDMERVTYLTPAEAEKAEKIEDDSNKLRFVPPTIEFRSIEDEYAAYRAENSIAKAAAEQNKEVGPRKVADAFVYLHPKGDGVA